MTITIPRERASVADNFRSKWHMLGCRNSDRERDRRALLEQDHKEVYHEMIYQAYMEGGKSHQQVADEYGVNKSTVWRICNRKGRI